MTASQIEQTRRRRRVIIFILIRTTRKIDMLGYSFPTWGNEKKKGTKKKQKLKHLEGPWPPPIILLVSKPI